MGELREAFGRFAGLLRAQGLRPNDRVVFLANNSIEHLLCYFGVMAAGALHDARDPDLVAAHG
jgi:acyl-CoA synthetase (AMP-forming)/AMP-acid ligase II